MYNSPGRYTENSDGHLLSSLHKGLLAIGGALEKEEYRLQGARFQCKTIYSH